jgi:cytochrome c5
MKPAAFAAAVIFCLAASACSEEQKDRPHSAAADEPTQAQIAYADKAIPADATLAAIYDRSCRSCHGVPDTGALLTGDGDAWRNKIEEKGVAHLIQSVKNGLNGMPAMGLCNDCSDTEINDLIDFMAANPT